MAMLLVHGFFVSADCLDLSDKTFSAGTVKRSWDHVHEANDHDSLSVAHPTRGPALGGCAACRHWPQDSEARQILVDL